MPYEDPIDYPDDPPDPPAPVVYPPYIATTSLPTATVGAPYSQALVAESGTAPYTFSLAAGNLPPGLALTGATGVIAGTPTASGSYTFIITVTDANALTGSAAFTIALPSLPSIQNQSLPAGTVGTPYQGSLVGMGGAAPYGFRVIAGGLPAGLVLATTGGITGTPTTPGSISVTIQIYDSSAPQGVGSATFIITIAAASLVNTVASMDECVLIACEDGGLYVIVPGQRHDTDYNGDKVGILQRWQGVPGQNPKLSMMRLGGGTVAAKGSGALNVTAIDDSGRVTKLSTLARPMNLSPTVETKRDFLAKGVPESERYGIAFDNGGVIDAWFELHTGTLYIRPGATARKG